MEDTNTLDLFLMYVPNQGGWGIFDRGSCPDPGAFPNWMYRKYTIPYERWREVFRKGTQFQSMLAGSEQPGSVYGGIVVDSAPGT